MCIDVNTLKELVFDLTKSNQAKILVTGRFEPGYINTLIHYAMPDQPKIRYLIDHPKVAYFLYRSWEKQLQVSDSKRWSGIVCFISSKKEVIRFQPREKVDFEAGLTHDEEDALCAEFFPGLELDLVSM